jgi:hypothetical protein
MDMSAAGIGTKNDCVGEYQQYEYFTLPTDVSYPVTQVNSYSYDDTEIFVL